MQTAQGRLTALGTVCPSQRMCHALGWALTSSSLALGISGTKPALGISEIKPALGISGTKPALGISGKKPAWGSLKQNQPWGSLRQNQPWLGQGLQDGLWDGSDPEFPLAESASTRTIPARGCWMGKGRGGTAHPTLQGLTTSVPGLGLKLGSCSWNCPSQNAISVSSPCSMTEKEVPEPPASPASGGKPKSRVSGCPQGSLGGWGKPFLYHHHHPATAPGGFGRPGGPLGP